MVEEYASQFYLPNINKWHLLASNSWHETRTLTLWKQKTRQVWDKVNIVDVRIPLEHSPKVGDRLPIKVKVHLGELSPDEVRVEAYIGRLDEKGEIPEGHPLPLLYTGNHEGNDYYFEGKLLCLSSGRIGFTIRCYPYKKELGHKFDLGLLTWWESH